MAERTRSAYGLPRDNDARERILQHVREHPGQTTREIAVALQWSSAQMVRYLLRSMQATGQVRAVRVARGSGRPNAWEAVDAG